jgi:hypothetical protein
LWVRARFRKLPEDQWPPTPIDPDPLVNKQLTESVQKKIESVSSTQIRMQSHGNEVKIASIQTKTLG